LRGLNHVEAVITGAAKPVGLAIPEVKGKLTGMALRVPTPAVSAVGLTVQTVKEASYQEIWVKVETASETYLEGNLADTTDEVTSNDFIHDRHSSTFDASSGIELNSRFFYSSVGMTTSEVIQTGAWIS
jgi:glyceraldehyde 3-phosphate dehydrogenase